MGYFFTVCKIENLKRKDKDETEDDTIKKDLEKLKKVNNTKKKKENKSFFYLYKYIYSNIIFKSWMMNLEKE